MKYCPLCGADLVKGIVEERERLHCSQNGCDYIFWDNPLSVIAGIVEYQKSIILAHNVEWPDGVYSVITGFLEKGETPEEGIIREVKEELGLSCEITDFIGVYSFHEMNQLILAYHIKAEGNICLNEELTDIKMIEKTKLKGWSFGTGLAVNDWIKKQKQND